MQILPDYGFAYIIDEVTGPVVPKHAWYYDAVHNDFMLKPIMMLEETTGPTVLVRIKDLTLKFQQVGTFLLLMTTPRPLTLFPSPNVHHPLIKLT